jgi:hypothetical protein
VIVIHTRRWRVVIIVMMVVTTRKAEHRHARQKKNSELSLDSHPVLLLKTPYRSSK